MSDNRDKPNEFRCGPLRLSEWDGLWKATADDLLMSEEEWNEKWDSLRAWLAKRYLVDYSIEWQRHCSVEGEYSEPESTLKIIVTIPEILTVDFLHYVQEWLRAKAPLWRVSIPTDNTNENLIMVYPDAIRINEEAEHDLERFTASAQVALEALIEAEIKQHGLRRKPSPPPIK